LRARRPEGSVNPEHLAAILCDLRPPAGDLADLAAASAEMPTRCIRLNILALQTLNEVLPFPTRPVPWYPLAGRFLTTPDRPAGYTLFGTGVYYIQDGGSLLAVAAMDLQPGQLVCDLCASPGGKTTAVLDRLGASGAILANEAVHSRLPPLVLNLARHGGIRFAVSRMDPTALAARFAGQFDAVLVDAPCSGQSLMARGKQTAKAYTPGAVEHCAARQQRILDAAATLVRPGGYLVYSTCTFSWLENEQQVIDMTRRLEDWAIEPVECLAPWQSSQPAPQGCYRVWPHLDGAGGAFACRLRREGSSEGMPGRASTRLCRDAIPLDVGRWQVPALVRNSNDRSDAWPPDIPGMLLCEGMLGPQAAYRKGKTWFPAYALAMRRDGGFMPDRTVDVSERQAAAYLRGETIPSETTGWVVVTWESWPLGWARGSGRQLANHLPLSARITLPTR
jgi:16S rRNA C967 or C1407 C5-methylase (RsmB/RsmF family)